MIVYVCILQLGSWEVNARNILATASYFLSFSRFGTDIFLSVESKYVHVCATHELNGMGTKKKTPKNRASVGTANEEREKKTTTDCYDLYFNKIYFLKLWNMDDFTVWWTRWENLFTFGCCVCASDGGGRSRDSNDCGTRRRAAPAVAAAKASATLWNIFWNMIIVGTVRASS